MERGAERSRETERGSERPREAQRGPGAGLRPLAEVYTPFAFVYRHRIAVKGILWNVAYSVGAHAALNTAALNTAAWSHNSTVFFYDCAPSRGHGVVVWRVEGWFLRVGIQRRSAGVADSNAFMQKAKSEKQMLYREAPPDSYIHTPTSRITTRELAGWLAGGITTREPVLRFAGWLAGGLAGWLRPREAQKGGACIEQACPCSVPKTDQLIRSRYVDATRNLWVARPTEASPTEDRAHSGQTCSALDLRADQGGLLPGGDGLPCGRQPVP